MSLQVLGDSITEFVNLISIELTRQSCLQLQIWIKIRMGRRIVLVSLIQVVVIYILKRKNKFIKLKEIIT